MILCNKNKKKTITHDMGRVCQIVDAKQCWKMLKKNLILTFTFQFILFIKISFFLCTIYTYEVHIFLVLRYRFKIKVHI